MPHTDLFAFRLTAWSLKILKEKTLVFAEPEMLPYESMQDHGSQVFSSPTANRVSREALCYNVIIHIHSVEGFTAVADPHLTFAPSSDNFGLGGCHTQIPTSLARAATSSLRPPVWST